MYTDFKYFFTQDKQKLPRLDPQNYNGFVSVFWTHTSESRAHFPSGALAHSRFRELLCHTCSRYHLLTPVYCLMPDHLHLLWIGVHPEANQRNATKFFRRRWSVQLGPVALQSQPYDHVLRKKEQERGALAVTINYILNNPLRAELVEDWHQYTGIGAMVPGYPDLDPRDSTFQEHFWHIHSAIVSKSF